MGQVIAINAALIDQFGEAARRKAEVEAILRPIQEDYQRLQAALTALYDAHPADASAVAEGNLYTLQVGPKANERTITTPERLFRSIRRMGLPTVLRVYRAALGELDKVLTADQQARYITVAQTGRRVLKAVPKASPASEPKAA
jgi:hypothetical protein